MVNGKETPGIYLGYFKFKTCIMNTITMTIYIMTPAKNIHPIRNRLVKETSELEAKKLADEIYLRSADIAGVKLANSIGKTFHYVGYFER